jgi:hypothetical protein
MGSGWGGAVGKWLIDTSEMKIVDLSEYWMWNQKHPWKRHPGRDDINCLASKISDYPEEVVKDFNYDLSLLEQFLDICTLHKSVGYSMDHQVDQVFILTSELTVRKVWDTTYSADGLYPENPAIHDKLYELMQFVSGEHSPFVCMCV